MFIAAVISVFLLLLDSHFFVKSVSVSWAVISLRSIEKKKKKEKKKLSLYMQRKESKLKKTTHTVLSAEQIILSKYNCCAVVNKLCMQTAEYILCVHCIIKDLIHKNYVLNISVSVFCSLIFFLSKHVQRECITSL